MIAFDHLYYRGRVGLHALLRALGVGPGDTVATQAFTCLAVPEGIRASGAAPVWVDIEAAGVNLDAADLARRIVPTTRAIIIQHTFGIPADVAALSAIARARDIPVIEDCCHTLESTIGGARVGTLGIGSFYSFEWGKPIVAGIGGSAIANGPELDARLTEAYALLTDPPALRVLKTQLQYAAFRILFRPSWYWQVRSAFHTLSRFGAAEGNYNPIEGAPAADFGWRMAPPLRRRLRRQLAMLERRTASARRIAAAYRAGITATGLVRPREPVAADSVYARYPLFTLDKPALLAAARSARIELADWYATPIHPLRRDEWQSVGYDPGSCPNAERASERIISLPTHPATTDRDVARAVDLLNRIGQ